MRAWIEPPELNVPAGLQALVGGHPLVAQTLVRRGYGEIAAAQAFLDPEQYSPALPVELPGMAQAVGRLEQAIYQGEGILVWGDFDVDGQTATTLLVATLNALGARWRYHIPVRAQESHGVGLAVLQRLLEAGGDPPVGVVLTCDTGIAAHDAILYAQGRGVEVVVTDHHELPDSLPPAYAVVNPRMLPDGHPLGALPGVGVAYKLAEALYARAGRSGEVEQHLDLVALGIVADVAQQTGETRYLLQRGLAQLRRAERLGLQEIMRLAELNPAWLTEEHIGFVLGPRLNALGRLGDANPVVELLTTQDLGRARLLAEQLEGLNARRQLLTSQVYQGALAQIAQEPALLEHAALVLAHPAWPAGVIGIVASRLVERFGRPVVLIAAPQGELGRASARSVEGVDITAAIASQAHLLEGYGGHRMAAGFAIQPEHIDEFRRGLGRAVERASRPSEAGLVIDGYLPLSALSLELVSDLERLAPFGAGNPALVLASREVHLVSQARVGRGEEHALLTVEDEIGNSQRVVWWQAGDLLQAGGLPEGPFDLAYHARASTYRGQRDVQVEWVDFRQERQVVVVQAAPSLEVIDYRQDAQPVAVLAWLLAQEPMQVWAEAEAPGRLAERLPEAGRAWLRPRHELEAGPALCIWTTPPDRSTLRSVLERVRPQRVYLFAIDPAASTPEAFLQRLAGLVKYALQSGEQDVLLVRLAAATAQREAAVRLGLAWLAGRGHVVYEELASGRVALRRSQGMLRSEDDAQMNQLRKLLEESNAYRAYFRRAERMAVIES
ncbi:MAG: single-stranded-DNA-specific exonuclease RecJ [Chloroflexota bacterium]